MELPEIIEKAERVKRSLNGDSSVKLIGRWIWTTFGDKPDADTRMMLKAERFRWNRKRGVWQFAGTRSTGSPNGRSYLELKYGAYDPEDVRTAATA